MLKPYTTPLAVRELIKNKIWVPALIPSEFCTLEDGLHGTYTHSDSAPVCPPPLPEAMPFFDSYRFLADHPVTFDRHGESRFKDCLSFDLWRVNPATAMPSRSDSENTATGVWLEFGNWQEYGDLWGTASGGSAVHDVNLDVYALSFEDGVIQLARLVAAFYGTYDGMGLPKTATETEEPTCASV
jgi:hypothetical protein